MTEKTTQQKQAGYAWHFLIGFLSEHMASDPSPNVSAALREIGKGFEIDGADHPDAEALLRRIGGGK